MLEYLSNTCRVSSSGRATASQAVGGGFESRILLQDLLPYIPYGRPKGRSCGAFCFYRPPGGVFFVLASLYFYLYLYPPGCGALFLLRGTGPACKKQTAAPAPPRLFLPQAAARLRSPPPLAVPPRLRRRTHTGALNHRLLLLFAGCTAAAKIPCLPAAAQLPNMGEAKDSKPSPCQGAGPQGKLAKRKRF